MAPKQSLKKIILLGSGALKIGEAGEFDYSGSQAAKALKEEGIKTVLINPNIATVQTSRELADIIYFLPLTPYFVEKVIAKEKPDGIFLGFGGQTALNCGLELHKKGILQKYNLEVLGTPIDSIKKTEDRLLFRKYIESLGLKVPQSITASTIDEVTAVSTNMHYPVIVRAGYSLGGLGSGVARNSQDLLNIAQKALSLTPQILIEEYLEHWKEIEYEVVRDKYDNTIVVCNMENFDPMGIHTGESIVFAPSQTLTNQEYHQLREIAINVVKSLPIVGECNIQYALNPQNGDYRIIEVNARLSRSSALASKATGYPLAYVAAKLALGYGLYEIQNQVTRATSAFFEPALDYIVVKIPRWDFLKFRIVNQQIGSEMQSVGEVMAIGRTFGEAFQKAIRSLDLGYEGIISDEVEKLTKLAANPKYKKLPPYPGRPYDIAYNLYLGQKEEDVYRETGIDLWFIRGIKYIVDIYKRILDGKNEIDPELLEIAKKIGFSDKQIASIYDKRPADIRDYRKKINLLPKACQIDTLAGEFPAKTNYLYFSYNRDKHDIEPSGQKTVGILGGGPYQIGSSVEFDWCAVQSATTAKNLGYSTIMINCNPETVSTDYDMSNRLYFEELTLERVLDIVDFEKCPLIISVGGQIPNTLAPKLTKQGVKLLGTDPASIDNAEDREKFSKLLDTLHIPQPDWDRLSTQKEAVQFADKIGYPVLIRPSYVLSGKAMFLAYSTEQLRAYLEENNNHISEEYPVVISKYIRGAKEVDFDAVARSGEIVSWAISEHVEHAGVHSGDATLVLPSFSLSQLAIDQINTYSAQIAKKLSINGPFNIQFIVSETSDRFADVLVIEANLRASRSFPFVSKVLNINFIDMATRIMLGEKVSKQKMHAPPYFAVKAPHFSFTRLRRADPVLRVEMASTGEVASFGDDLMESYIKSVLATGVPFPKKAALLSLGGVDGKKRFLPGARILQSLGFKLYATNHTSEFLKKSGIRATSVYKVNEGIRPNVVDLIQKRKVDLVINLSDAYDLKGKDIEKQETDGFLIRRAAVDSNIPLFTKATIANLFVQSLAKYHLSKLKIRSWNEYVKNVKTKHS
ncbi:carbamoyl-phosphate synthase (glutamine-hydrolyzing) large subunit [Candidatus Gottesmanbacteria bacterium]|nr:carbamoyl-phosphate synthase (glutamine-hydrolyzing) large subunit [Candidatus Gottesmanbacteria bacterium]